MKSIIFTFLFGIMANTIYAQGEAAVPFLSLQQSPLFLSAGSIGVSNPAEESSGFYYNPSLLGYYSKENHASFFSIPKQAYYNYLITPTFSNYGFNLGYNLEKSPYNLPLSIGLGFLHHRFTYGTFNVTTSEDPTPIGKFESYDSYNCISLGIGYEYIFQFNVGMAIKLIDSHLSAKPTENEKGTGSANITAFDYGAFIVAPLSKLFLSDVKYFLDEFTYIYPTSSLAFGVSLLNYGNEVKYIDEAQSDPLPRTARVGYTFNIGTTVNIKSEILNLFNYYFSSEAEDMLIKKEKLEDYKYQAPFSDIQFIKNLIEQKDDRAIVVHRGHILNLFETIKISSGRLKGRGFYNAHKSNGYVLSSKGIIKLLSLLVNNSTIHYLKNHIELNYYNSHFNVDTSYESNLEGFSILFKGLEL